MLPKERRRKFLLCRSWSKVSAVIRWAEFILRAAQVGLLRLINSDSSTLATVCQPRGSRPIPDTPSSLVIPKLCLYLTGVQLGFRSTFLTKQKKNTLQLQHFYTFATRKYLFIVTMTGFSLRSDLSTLLVLVVGKMMHTQACCSRIWCYGHSSKCTFSVRMLFFHFQILFLYQVREKFSPLLENMRKEKGDDA